MTISTTNITSDACLICQEDYTNTERADTAKVVELACHHFYHLDCLSPWLSMNEKSRQELSCCYHCKPSLLPKRSPLEIITAEAVAKRFIEIEQNQHLGSQSEVINCLPQLKPHSNCIAILLNDLIQKQSSEDSCERLRNWVTANVSEESRATACLLINEVLQGGQVLRSLQQEIRRLAAIPMAKWSTETEEEGVAVYLDGASECRMRVSKDYLQRATFAYLSENIHSSEKFERNLAEIEEEYNYDQEVLDGIQEVRDLRKVISDRIKENESLPMDKMILSINELLNKIQLSENPKRIIPLIIQEILLQRGALRTLWGEVDRWKKEPVEEWPKQIKKNGVRFFFDDSGFQCPANHFIRLVQAAKVCDKVRKTYNALKTPLAATIIGTVTIETLFYIKREFEL